MIFIGEDANYTAQQTFLRKTTNRLCLFRPIALLLARHSDPRLDLPDFSIPPPSDRNDRLSSPESWPALDRDARAGDDRHDAYSRNPANLSRPVLPFAPGA